MCRYFLVILCAWISLGAAAGTGRAGSELDLLRKYQNENKAASDKLKQETSRLLKQETSPARAERDLERLRKLLGQLQEDHFLPREERTLLIRQLQDRLRECRSLAEMNLPETPAVAVEPKIRVKQAVFVNPGLIVVNPGPMTTIVPDGGTRVLGGFSYLAEGRNEYGVPGLGAIPYLGRAFRNVNSSRISGGISISVSARIIIMEEEEARFLGR